MALYFTPVKGKEAFLKDWTKSKLTKEQCLGIPDITGVAVVLGQSELVTIDLDDLKWCLDKGDKTGIDFRKIMLKHFNITSPKINRGKIVFKKPPDIDLEYLKFPPNSNKTKLELRTGNRYDVWCDSEHPEGGKYGHSGSEEIKDMPPEILDFWLSVMSYRKKEKKASGTGEVPLLNNGAMSVIHVFNTIHPLDTILRECGYQQQGNKWRSPHSTSGSFGLSTQESYLNPWDVCYSHHESDGDLAGRPIDAFEIAAKFSYPDKDINQAKLIFTHDQANKLKALDESGNELPTSIHLYNNPNLKVETSFPEMETDNIPIFPAGILERLPEPWPLIARSWKMMPRVESQELLLPTILSVHAHMLSGDFRTAYGRRPGFYFLTIAPSTAHKDGNSRDAIQAMAEAIFKKGKASLFFSQILNHPTTITADTSFVEAFRLDGTNKGHLFWLNTEATRMFQKMTTTGNDNVAAVADKIIEVVDGRSITGKQKVSTKTNENTPSSILDPNVQLLFYTQPETIEKYITEELVDSGLLGRATITLSPKKVQRTQMFIEPTKDISSDLSDDLSDFYASIRRQEKPINVLFSDHGQLKTMQDYHTNVLLPMDTDDSMYKMISRLGNTAEQLYALIVGICHLWDDYKGVPRRMGIPVEPMLTLITYWAHVKKHVINNYVHKDLDPLSSHVLQVTQELISGKLKPNNKKAIEIRDKHGMIQRGQITLKIKSRPKLLSKLNINNDSRNVSNRVSQLIDIMVKDGTLIEDKSTFGNSSYIGVPKY